MIEWKRLMMRGSMRSLLSPGQGVTSREVVEAFGVRVAQKHLARLFNESNGSITRSKVDNKYVYSIRDDA